MQKEELSDSRNRQAAETNGGQNEDQIWQREETRAAAPDIGWNQYSTGIWLEQRKNERSGCLAGFVDVLPRRG
jgi:hypothetical protein